MLLRQRIALAQQKLGLNNQELAAELRITPEWIGKILNGKAAGSDDIGLRLEELLRRRGLEVSSIPHSPSYQKLSVQETSAPPDDPRFSGSETPSPMRIQPGFAAPAREPSEQDCLYYLRKYLQLMRTKPGGLGHTYVELQRNFPLPAEILNEEEQR
jgi:transcriptional regulator with XRE-family HTH domain